METIQTINLSKNFGNTRAVNDISIHVNEGEIYGFLGLNGAGKTTAIRMLLGMIKPSRGSFLLFGKKTAQHPDIWNQVGYLVETPYAYPDLSVAENLEIYHKLRQLRDRSQISAIIEQLQLGPYRDKKARHLSLGNMQRLGLAKALMHKPRLLILDEPTNGLDPAGIVEVRQLLQSLAKEGSTIFLSSHILHEISIIANRIGIIHQGHLIEELYTDALDKALIRKLHIKTNNNTQAISLLQQNGFAPASGHEGFIALDEQKAIDHPEQVAVLLSNAGLPPKHLAVFEEDLEHYFLRIIESQSPAV